VTTFHTPSATVSDLASDETRPPEYGGATGSAHPDTARLDWLAENILWWNDWWREATGDLDDTGETDLRKAIDAAMSAPNVWSTS